MAQRMRGLKLFSGRARSELTSLSVVNVPLTGSALCHLPPESAWKTAAAQGQKLSRVFLLKCN